MLYDAYSRPVHRIGAADGPPGVTDMSTFGHVLEEYDIKAGLRGINPDIHFDLGAKKDKYHPRIDEWQGVFHNGRHICSMDRGNIPEYDCWYMENGKRLYVMRIGWRGTLHMVTLHVPGVTWDALCARFGVEKKAFKGNITDLVAGKVAR